MASPTSKVLHFSETPRSSILGATSTSSPSPSPTSGSSGSGGFFSTAGSPALVLAFLAVGIFAGGLLSMLFLRHFGIVRLMRQRQLALTQEAVPAGDQFILGRRSRRRTFGEKPMLWDYEHHPQMKSAGSWGQIVPISVRTIQPPPIYPMPPDLPPPHPRTGMRSRWFKRQPLPPPPVVQYKPGKLLITVAIAMPAQNTQLTNQPRPTTPVYELGFLNVPWDAQKLSSLNTTAPILPPENTLEDSP